MSSVGDTRRSLTLEEIGLRAGVSRSTVSRVLNNHPNVRPEVRAQVEAVITETGYRPHPAARALASARSGLIGLVVLTDVNELFGDPYYSELVKGIQQACTDLGLIFAIFPVRGPDGDTDALIAPIAQGLVDGVIVTAGPHSDGLLAALRNRGIKLVVVGQPEDQSRLLRVDVENRLGAQAATRHLVEDGYQRIGFVGTTPQFRFGVERMAGYRDAMTEAGRDTGDRLIRLGAPTEEGGREATHALLDESPDAIFVATDPMAAGAYQAIAERGLRIPGDVAVIGFDGLPRPTKLDPPLSTVVQPVADVGLTAVALLADDAEATSVILPTTLRLGGSCHPVEHAAHEDG